MPAKVVKKSGKENVQPKVVDEDFEGDSFADYAEEPKKAGPSKSTDDGDLKRKLQAMTGERDKLRGQRDGFAKQFEELSKNRSTAVETLFEKYKGKASIQAKAQNEIITNLTELNEKLQARATSLEKGIKDANAAVLAALQPDAKPDPKEMRLLKEELAKAKASLKAKEERLTHVEKEYKFEMEQHKKVAKNTTTTPAVSTTPEEAEKDAASLKLYEDLTDLGILNVKVVQGKNGKEYTFNCIQTVGSRSLNFKLRSYNELSKELLAEKADNPWVKTLLFTPEVEYETDKEWVKRLGVFGEGFSAPREQLAGLWDGLKLALE